MYEDERAKENIKKKEDDEGGKRGSRLWEGRNIEEHISVDKVRRRGEESKIKEGGSKRKDLE